MVVRRWMWLAIVAPAVLAMGGCPWLTGDDGSDEPVKAIIGLSTTRGEPPLRVVATGVDSTSRFGEIVQFAWDFDGLATFDTMQASYEFTSPGLYRVTLTVTDETGRTSTSAASVQVLGGTAAAVIKTDVVAGLAPLAVKFDGSESSSDADPIRDYYWDFGDGGTSRAVSPTHLFQSTGTFTVTLRVVTGGGAESTASTTITVGTREGSLQFDGGQIAILPFSLTDSALSAFTFEAWIRADLAGGAVVAFGTPEVALTAVPASNVLRVSAAGQPADVPAANLSGAWRHVAFSYDGSTAALYLDGVPLPTTDIPIAVTARELRLGSSFDGRIARVRFWNVVRTASEIAANRDVVISGGTTGLLGSWTMNEGTGQTLANGANSALPGNLGLTTDVEGADPAWSSDSP